MGRLDIESALAAVIRRLTGRFSPQVPADVVAATVRACAARWQDARVIEFVPLLVERKSTEQLRTLLVDRAAVSDHSDSATPGAGGFSQVA